MGFALQSGPDPRSVDRDPAARDRIHLSVVATSRNDDHGGSLTRRMQHFVDGLVEQCRRHRLPAELVLVEWNPPADRPPLSDALRWPEAQGPCSIRIVTVPRELHARMAHAAHLPLFQMFAKNVGIRRARGQYVLATNIDILFSDRIARYLRDRLQPGRVYRADRCDVPAEVPAGVPFDQILEFCERETFRINRRRGTRVKQGGRWRGVGVDGRRLARLARLRDGLVWVRDGIAGGDWPDVARRLLRAPAIAGRLAGGVTRRVCARLREGRPPFTNACGDFTLLSRADWFAQRGYPEWEIFSWHLDSILLYQAFLNGLKEVYVGRSRRIFHIDHETGSGYSPEGERALFGRLDARGIAYLTWPRFQELIADMRRTRKAGRPVVYNPESWGLAHVELPETIVRGAWPAIPVGQPTVA
jgi:hypothetical protein